MKNNNNNNIDELFRKKLQNYEQEPPAYLLENVLAGAAGNTRRRKLIYWRIAGIAAALLVAFVAGWQFNAREGIELKQQTIISQNSAPKTGSEKIIQSEKKAVSISAETSSLPIASSDTFSQERKDKKQRITGSSTSLGIAPPEETSLIAVRNESVILKPLKSIYRLIKHNTEPAKTLQERKDNEAMTEWAEKTIDQQIMDQNQQIILAENQAKEKGRWLVGAQVSPAYSVSRSSHTKEYASNMLNSENSSPVALGGGLSVEYKPGKRWSLQSGVYYSGIGQKSGNSSNSNSKDYALANTDRGSEYFNANVNIDTKSNKMMMNSTAGVIEFSGVPSQIVLGTSFEDKSMVSAVIVSDARFIQNFEYIEIPLYLRYTLIDSRFDVEMLGGFSSNLLVGNQTFLESGTGKSLIGKTKDMETLNYSGTLGIGVKYGLSKRIFLNVEPRVKYYLNSLNSNSSVTYKPYTIGVFTGLSYEF